jgi:hypothetical protein
LTATVAVVFSAANVFGLLFEAAEGYSGWHVVQKCVTMLCLSFVFSLQDSCLSTIQVSGTALVDPPQPCHPLAGVQKIEDGFGHEICRGCLSPRRREIPRNRTVG